MIVFFGRVLLSTEKTAESEKVKRGIPNAYKGSDCILREGNHAQSLLPFISKIITQTIHLCCIYGTVYLPTLIP